MPAPAEARTPHGEDTERRAFDLLKELVALTAERWASPGRFGTLARQWVPEGTPAQIRFLTQVKAIVRSMPTQVFVDLDARQTMLGALQEALDQAIEQEEADAQQAQHMPHTPHAQEGH